MSTLTDKLQNLYEVRPQEISAEPTLESLAWTLRHPEIWPKGFTWDYTFWQNCAIGLAVRIWPQIHSELHLAKSLHMPDAVFCQIFYYLKFSNIREVTPEIVAKAIEDYIKECVQQPNTVNNQEILAP